MAHYSNNSKQSKNVTVAMVQYYGCCVGIIESKSTPSPITSVATLLWLLRLLRLKENVKQSSPTVEVVERKH